MRTFAVAAACAVLLGIAPSLAQVDRKQPEGTSGRRSGNITVTGCLSVNPEARLYVLTVVPDRMAQTAQKSGVTKEPTTINYQLVGGSGLEKQVGNKIEVTGRLEPGTARSAESESERSEPPRNAPRNTGDSPKVTSKTETRIRTQVLRVQDFHFLESNCKPTER